MSDCYDLVIVGAGVSGMLVLGCIPAEITWKIAVVDPSFSGGDLGVKWGPIRSNTTAKQVRDALRSVPRFASDASLELDAYRDAEHVPLHILASDVERLAAPLLDAAECIIDKIVKIGHRESEFILYSADHGELYSRRIVLCTGATPKMLDISRPTIPLEIAFEPVRLNRIVKPGDIITVFGCSHSGVLAIKNAHDAGAHVYGIYGGKTPFLYARDGEYEGVKGDAADICDSIRAGHYPNVTLISYANGTAVRTAISKSKYIVHSVGFKPRNEIEGINVKQYDATTGQLAPGIWGFGIGFPSSNVYNGKTYYDVGIPPFVKHIKANIDHIIV